MKAFGVDIGTSSIKIAELESNGRTITIQQLFQIPLSVDPNRDLQLQVLEELRKFSALYAHSDHKWIIGLPQSDVSMRLKKFPFTNRAQIQKSLPFELDEDIPLDTSDAIFDFRFTRTHPNGAEVAAIASQLEPIEQQLERARDGGFEPDCISVEGFATANLLESFWSPPEASLQPIDLGTEKSESSETTQSGIREPFHPTELLEAAESVLQIGHRHSLLIVTRGGALVGSRSIEWGGIDLAYALERTFKVPFIEAIKVLQSKSFVLLNTQGATRDQIAMHKAIADCAQALVREIRLTHLDVQTEAKVRVNSMRITGGCSQIQNFAPWLTQMLELPVNLLSLSDLLAVHPRLQSKVALEAQIESVSATAIGLAIEAFRKPNSPAINLRKGVLAAKNESFKLFWENWGTTVQILAATYVLLIAFAFTREVMTESLATLSDEVLMNTAISQAGVKPNLASADSLYKFIERARKETANQKAMLDTQDLVSAMDVLLSLSQKLKVQKPAQEGQGYSIDHLVIENDTVLIEGRAFNQSWVDSVEEGLKELALPQSLKKVPITTLKAGAPGTGFAFSMKVSRKL